MERVYYEISERMAETANDINSMSSYKKGSATMAYKESVDDVYNIVEKIKESKPSYYEKALRMAERYSKKLADYYNSYYRNEASCPSILICGAGNFPVKKKNKQNSRRESLMSEWEYLENYKEKIENILTCKQPILSNDENAIELLQQKLEMLEEEQNKMKKVNAYYRKYKTLDGCEDITPEMAEKLKAEMGSQWHYEDKPFMSYLLTNNNATIRNTRQRLEKLVKAKKEGSKKQECEYFSIVENTEEMRLQLFFDEKPEERVRSILKCNGFKWAPSQSAWQRQLTENARYALKRVIQSMQELNLE